MTKKERTFEEHQSAMDAIIVLKEYCEASSECDDCIFRDICRFYWNAEPPIWIDELKVISQQNS